jgi:hypothetical protein
MKIVFFERSPFMGVELLDLLRDFVIVSYDKDLAYMFLKKRWPLCSYGNTDFSMNIGNDTAVENMLTNATFTKHLRVDSPKIKALFFYMNPQINKAARDAGFGLLLPEYEIQERLGNKFNIGYISTKLKLLENRTMIFRSKNDLEDAFSRCIAKLGLPFMIQGPDGVSGEDTFLIKDASELDTAIRALNNGFKAAKFIKHNIPLSVHVCIEKENIVVRGPFIQLIGFPELATSRYQFCGNDTNQSLLTKKIIETIREISTEVAGYFRAEGYLGILGIDFFWDTDSNGIYLQELNTRLVGLTRLLTGIQKDQDNYPDILRHLEAFGFSDFQHDVEHMDKDKELDLDTCEYTQLIITNTDTTEAIIFRDVSPGIYEYKDKSLHFIGPSLFLSEIEKNHILLAYVAPKTRVVQSGGVLARILLKRTALMRGVYELDPHVRELIIAFREFIIS